MAEEHQKGLKDAGQGVADVAPSKRGFFDKIDDLVGNSKVRFRII
jgi:hypothetical protein